jgi:hypothetical protein
VKHWQRKYGDLAGHLEQLCERSVTPEGVNIIVSATVDYANNVLQWMQHRRSYTFQRMGLSLRDVANDVVAELLADGPDGACHRLRHALMCEYAAPTSSLLARYSAVCVRTVQQNITRVFAEFDPVRARLLETVRRHVRMTDRYLTIDGCMGRLYTVADPAVARLHCDYPDELRLRHAAFRATNLRPSPMIAVLEHCLASLADDATVQCAIFEHDLLRLVVSMLGAELDAVTDDASTMQLPDDAQSELLRHIERTIIDAREWISTKFIRPQRLTSTEAEAILSACRSALLDAAYADQRDHYSYLRERMQGLTYETYRAVYRHRTEYIFRKIFSSMGRHLLKQDMEGTRLSAMNG